MRFTADTLLRFVIPVVYAQRSLTFGLLMAATLVLGYFAAQLKPDAGFEKQIPLDHPYMQVFKQYEKAFGGANFVSIALINHAGDIYNAAFLDRLKAVTDEVFFLPGVDRSRVTSLFTPGVRYIEIVEGGFRTDNVVPRQYQPTPEMFQLIRGNVGKAGLIGRLVSTDQRGAMVTAELLEFDPITGEKLDYHKVATQLEEIRGRFQDAAPESSISIHIIGFAKVIGDVTDASLEVITYFLVAILLMVGLLWAFCGSLRLSLLPLSAALTAVVWELGLLHLAGFGLDPFAILVPFLILSIGVSHGVQYINGWGNEVTEHHRDSFDASVETFRRLFIPGTVAILTNVIGFATLTFIQIDIVREMAINAALGMAAVIITNKVMLPIVLSWVKVPDIEKFRRRQRQRAELGDRLWQHIANFSTPRLALPTLALALLALTWALWMYPKLTIGDSQSGVPELKPDGRYNRDSAAIVRNFSVGVDVLKVMAETSEYACVQHAPMDAINRYAWAMQNVPGVQSVLSMPQISRQVTSAWNEGSPKWMVLPRNSSALALMVGAIPSSLGLQNPDCSVMPVLIFTSDHRATTIARIIDATRKFDADNPDSGVRFALASGNVGVMAATNEEIKARELVVIVWVHLTLLIFVWISFRSLAGVISIITPLVLCSLLTYGGMASLGIGMKSATLPVAAFGVGIGVDDGIYLWSVLSKHLAEGLPLRAAYYQALRSTGKAVVFTSLSLIVAVFTWLFSQLQFQADMGLLLLFMFTTNLFGAVLMLPALAWLCFRIRPSGRVAVKAA